MEHIDENREVIPKLHEAARMAIAVEKYRLAHNGALPERLEDLEGLPKPLVDPVFGKPFEFEISPTNRFRMVGRNR